MKFQELTDEQWLSALAGELSLEGIPKLPSEQTQLNFTGASGKSTLIQAFDFYKIVKEKMRKYHPVSPTSKILDFGCGWGRITRFWLKDFQINNIYGVDPLPEMIKICKENIPVNFSVIDPAPPVDFSDGTFDVISAYSVFSHLNEAYTRKWFNEFHRILNQGALLIVTTRSRIFIEYCASINKNPIQQHARGLASCFKNCNQYLDQYDSGRFVHQATGGGGLLLPEFFGESCIPKKYFKNFNNCFEMIDFVERMPNEPTQACVILRKK